MMRAAWRVLVRVPVGLVRGDPVIALAVVGSTMLGIWVQLLPESMLTQSAAPAQQLSSEPFFSSPTSWSIEAPGGELPLPPEGGVFQLSARGAWGYLLEGSADRRVSYLEDGTECRFWLRPEGAQRITAYAIRGGSLTLSMLH